MMILLLACTESEPQPVEIVHPCLMVRASQKAEILERVESEPYASLLVVVEARAAEDYRETSLFGWSSSDHGHNAAVAQANAFLAWLNDDADAAARAIEGIHHLDDDWEDNGDWDVNIRMPYPLMGYGNTHDLLLATDWYPDEDAAYLEETLGSINEQFYEMYVQNETMRQISLGFSQNNHPIRTSSAIGYVGLALPEHPDAQEWLDFAVSELDYLWGPDGQYVQADGGISEGPMYYHFGLGAALAFFIAHEGARPEATYTRTCINRQDVDPWADHGCVEGQSFEFDNPLFSQSFSDAFSWSVALRLPWGERPPLADGRFGSPNGGPLIEAFADGSFGTWDWSTNATDSLKTTGSMELTPYHLAWMPEDAGSEAPPWTSRVMPSAGNAVFRSSWDEDAIYALVVAEHGSARKTLHDHVDGTSFQVAAYGEYLLIDPGYYKPNELNNAVTAQGDAHNLILIEGQGPPDKGLLSDFGDTDAYLENELLSADLDYVEARIVYEDTEIVRSFAMVRDRWFFVADRLDSEAASREHRWRLGGWAGHESIGGSFELEGSKAAWERDLAGVEVFLASTEAGLVLEEPEFVEYERPHVHEIDGEQDARHHRVIDGVVTAVEPGFVAIIAPYEISGERLSVESVGQGAWLVDGRDLVWLTGGATELELEGWTVETDAELVFVSLDGDLEHTVGGSVDLTER